MSSFRVIMNSNLKFLRVINGSKLVSQVRNYEKYPPLRRYGYKETVLLTGLLPRHKDFKPIFEKPTYKVKNAWSQKKALFGQNDYIGDGNIHPKNLLGHIPFWLRGWRGNEYRMLQRKLKFFGSHWSYMRPKKYVDLMKRLRYLHRWMNWHTPN